MKTSTSSMRAAAVVIGIVLATLPGRVWADTWVELKGGEFPVASDQLAHLKETLQAQITAAAEARHVSVPDWQKFLIQYRSRKMQGQRVVEVHGSCEFDPRRDLKREFIDERIVDGGTCYFAVIYEPETGRFSNVIFHGNG